MPGNVGKALTSQNSARDKGNHPPYRSHPQFDPGIGRSVQAIAMTMGEVEPYSAFRARAAEIVRNVREAASATNGASRRMVD